MNIQEALFFFFLKKGQFHKTKEIINISYLIMVLIKISLSIFLVLSQYRVACNCRIIGQMSIYNWMQNCIFQYLWYCIFIFLKSNYNLLPQVRWFVTGWVESIIICSDSNLTENIIRETIKVERKEMDQDRILTHSRFNDTLRIWLVLLGNSQSSTTKKWINKKRHLTINNIKLNFLNKASSMLYPVKHHLKFQEL